jgi:hypothetical protein
MTTKAKTARFTRGAECDYLSGGLFGTNLVTGVIEEVAEDWVGFRYHNEDEIRVFGEHPLSIGALAELKPVTR